jgi:hypothetical protein
MAATPIYSATKAGIHSFTLSLRDQFANTGVEIFEIIPPAVAGTYLGGRGLRTAGVPLDEYIDSLMKGLHGGEAEIAYDTSARVYRASRDQLDERTAEITRMIPIPVPAGSQEQAVSGELVYVEGGTFMMGSTGGTDRERPVHQVTVGSFHIGKYEVTQKEWTEVMGSNPSNFNGATLPVEQLDWYDAIAYCNKRSVKEGLTPAYTINGQNVTWDKSVDEYRLPTESEWEYAARGGKNSSAPFTYAGSNRWAMSLGIVETAGTGRMRQDKKRPMLWDYMT